MGPFNDDNKEIVMKEKEPFEVEELDDQQLDEVAGGTDVDVYCPTNSGNCVRGCACPGGGSEIVKDTASLF